MTTPRPSGSAPRVSVVVPTYEMARWLPECLASVRAQDFDAWEIVVVDDGSRDDPATVVASLADPRVRVVRQAHAGLSAARNRGAAETRAPLLVFLDADDRLRPRALGRLVERAEATPAAAVVYGECVSMDERGRVYGRVGRPLFAPRPSGRVLRALLARNFITTSAACVRRRALEAAGPYRTELPRAQDWEMWCRLALEGELHYLAGEPLLERRVHDESISATLGVDVAEHLRTVDVVFANPSIRARFSPRELGALERKQRASVYALAGTECLKRGRFVEAERHLRAALALDPRSPRELLLWCASSLRRCPPWLLRHLK